LLTPQDNELLTRVGHGTAMGNLLRRYWTPALLSSELPEPDSPPVRVRILGEDLVAFRDSAGKVGLFPQACPHRGASLFFGRNEEEGLRCVYHGWKFDAGGACVDMPSEPAESNFKTKVRVNAYPTHEAAGIVFAYLGPPEKQPRFRDMNADGVPAEMWGRAFKVPAHCNWLQRMEGNVDTSHVSWLHQYHGAADLPDDGTDAPGSYPTWAMSWRIWRNDGAPSLELEDTWYGFKYAGLRRTPNGNTHVRVTHYVLPFTTFIPNIPFQQVSSWCVPIDDGSCYFFGYAPRPLPNQAYRDAMARDAGEGGLFANTPYASQVTGSNGANRDAFSAANDYQMTAELKRGTFFSGIPNFGAQDLAVTESMGRVIDRSREHLGTTDRAVIKLRSLLLRAVKDLQAGIEPPALDAALPFDEIRGAEKILTPGEDWRVLGTNDDPQVAISLRAPEAATPSAGS
jgi:phenylpropionate dioxygenase-like ring-hydroxylating dioxygenase large terminal subunit